MNREEFFNKNLLRELVYFVIVTILVSFNIGWIAVALYSSDLPGINFLTTDHIVPGQGGTIMANNVNVLITGIFVTMTIWIIRMFISKSNHN